MTCYQPDSSKTLSERGCIGFTFSPQNCFYWGAAAPRPPAITGGLPAPQTLWWGACSPPCPSAYREALPLRLSVFFGTKILVPGSWYQSVCRGARGAAGPPPEGLGGWKPPTNSGGSGGRQPPSKNNFMDPDPTIFYPKINLMALFPCYAVPLFVRANILRAVPCQIFSVPNILRAVPCHKYAGPWVRAVPERPCLIDQPDDFLQDGCNLQPRTRTR